ncbi:hypothetical protein C8K36_10564 [Rhodococcus sp. OK519]|nr:hypothetical protein C8K36_10564 [Rhodococcus sp. OK519]
MSRVRHTNITRRTGTARVPIKITRGGTTITKTVPMKINTVTRTTTIRGL